jgi:hypothetical protein
MAVETMNMPQVPIAEPADIPEDTSATKKVRDSTKWLHKTRLCVYSIQGTCRLGSKCSFAHAASEVQDAPNLRKTQFCEAFEKGNCNNPNCSFAHGEEELRLSPNYKNKLCKWFGKGKCRNGDECGFAHGEHQLRKEKEENSTGGMMDTFSPPPGLSLEVEKSQPLVLDLDASLLEAKTPAFLEQQVEGMSATISALQWKMDEMVLRTQVSGMKQFLGQLSAQCAELEQALKEPSPSPAPTSEDIKANAPWKKTKTPLKTPLSSKAQIFQPLSSKASLFVPSQPSYDGYEAYWPSDDSTSMGSGDWSASD